MKYDDAEKAMAKLEGLYPDRNVYVVSEQASPDDAEQRLYTVQVVLEETVNDEAMKALSAVRDDVGCRLSVGAGNVQALPEGNIGSNLIAVFG